MKSIEQLEIEIKEKNALVRENKTKTLLVTIGDMITKRQGWIKRREEEIAELTDLDNKMRQAYLLEHDAVLEAVQTEISEFDQKNQGRSRKNY